MTDYRQQFFSEIRRFISTHPDFYEAHPNQIVQALNGVLALSISAYGPEKAPKVLAIVQKELPDIVNHFLKIGGTLN